MGNCQAIDAATLVIQHPNGKVEKFFGAVSASEVMKMNPGHYVALLISTTLCPSSNPKSKTNGPDNNAGDDHDHKNSDMTNEKKTSSSTGSVRITRIKLLRPTDTLVLGQVYRLITTQEVMKGLWAKKQAKGKRSNQFEPLTAERLQRETVAAAAASRRSEAASELDKDNNQVMTKTDRHHHRPRTSTSSSGSTSSSQSAATARPRTWQPSLQSISEAAS